MQQILVYISESALGFSLVSVFDGQSGDNVGG